MITKAQLQAEREDDLLSRSRHKSSLVTAVTSGSSGRPFRTYRDPCPRALARRLSPAGAGDGGLPAGRPSPDRRGATRAAGHELDALAQADLLRPARPRARRDRAAASDHRLRLCLRLAPSRPPRPRAWPAPAPAQGGGHRVGDPGSGHPAGSERRLRRPGVRHLRQHRDGRDRLGVRDAPGLPCRRGLGAHGNPGRRNGWGSAAADQPAQRGDAADPLRPGRSGRGRRRRSMCLRPPLPTAGGDPGAGHGQHPAPGRQPRPALQRHQRGPRHARRTALPDRAGTAGTADRADRERRPR